MGNFVVVITLNYNQSLMTIQCVESVLASSYSEFIVFVIDNGSSQDDYTNLLNHFSDNAKVIVQRIAENVGYVRGVNYGLRISADHSADFFMIMNNDTVIDVNSLTELVNCCKRYDRKAIISGKVLDFYEPDLIQQTGLIFTDKRYLTGYSPGKGEKDSGYYDEEAERDSLDDVFWLLPSRILDDIGYYCDLFFLYAEQGDFAQRARRAGYKLIYQPKAKIWHKGSITSGDGNKHNPKVLFWRAKSSVIFQYRNLKFRYFLTAQLLKTIKEIAKLFIQKGDFRIASLARLKGYTAGFKLLLKQKPDDGYNPYN